jgi:hypothetical protein
MREWASPPEEADRGPRWIRKTSLPPAKEYPSLRCRYPRGFARRFQRLRLPGVPPLKPKHPACFPSRGKYRRGEVMPPKIPGDLGAEPPKTSRGRRSRFHLYSSNTFVTQKGRRKGPSKSALKINRRLKIASDFPEMPSSKSREIPKSSRKRVPKPVS